MQVGVLSQAIAGRCFSSPPANRQDNYMRWRGGRFSPRPPTEDEAEIVWPSTQISSIYLEIFGEFSPICQFSRNFLDFFREIRPNIFAYSRRFSPIATFRAYFFSIFRFFAIFRENHPNFSRKRSVMTRLGTKILQNLCPQNFAQNFAKFRPPQIVLFCKILTLRCKINRFCRAEAIFNF